MWRIELELILLVVVPVALSRVLAFTKTEVFDAPDVRVESDGDETRGFYVSKTRDLNLRCVIRMPTSVRLDEVTRQIVWRYNDADVNKAGIPSGAVQVDADRLTLKASVDAELLAGKYSCNVTWSTYGSVLSPPVQVEFAALKKYKSDPPMEERVWLGRTAYLPCHAPESNPGPAKLSFILNGTKEITISHDRYFISPTGLQIGDVNKSDQGVYVCRATHPISGQSRDSKPTQLIVLDDDKSSIKESVVTVDESVHVCRPSPHLQQRNTLDVRRGDNVSLECLMVDELGRSASNVRWEKYGSVLPPVDRRQQVLGNMLMHNVTKEDEGTYVCRPDNTPPTAASDRKHSAATSHARFIIYSVKVHDSVKAKLTIERDTEEDDKSATSGVAYRLTCQAASGLASDLEFWVNGKPLLSQSLNPVRTRFQSGESPKWSFTLTESTLRKGVYQCMVRGREPFDQATVDSDNLYVESWFNSASGTTRTEMDNEDAWSASGMEDSASVTKPIGTLDTDASIALARKLPRILAGPENETSSVGASVTFVCQVSSNTDVVYWLKDGERIFDYDPNEDREEDEDGMDDHGMDDQPMPNRYKRIGTGSLNIETTTDQDGGWYTCVAANSYGNSTAKAYLDFERVVEEEDKREKATVDHGNSEEEEDGNDKTRGKNWRKKKIRLDPPSVFRYSNTSVLLRWQLTHDQRTANSGVRFFKLQYKKLSRANGEKTPSWKTLDQELPSHSHSGTIDGLEPGQKYKFRYAVVYDNNDHAVSRMTPAYEMTVEQKLNAPKMAPTLVNVKTLSWSAISLYWDYPSSEQAPLDGFIIMYRRIYYADTSSTYQNETVIGGWTREHVLSHLLPATLYQIKMVAFNTAGRSRESNVLEETTLSTDGTKTPRTFDAVGSVGVASNRPLSRDATVTRTNAAVSWPPVSANRAEETSGVLAWLDISSEMLFYIIGGILGAFFILLIIFMAVCTVRHRKQKKLVKAARGKYRDASKKIYREQALCNDPTVMKDMYPPLSNSASFQPSATGSGDEDNDHEQCPPPPAPSQSTTALVRNTGPIPPPPSLTGYANGTMRPGAILNLYSNPLEFDDGEDEQGSQRRYGLLNRSTSEFVDGEEAEALLNAEHKLLTETANNSSTGMKQNGSRYAAYGTGGQPVVHYRRMPPPLILTSVSALTSTSPFGNGLDNSFVSSSPHTSLASNYSPPSHAGEVHSAPANGLSASSHTPLLPPPMFSQLASESIVDDRKRIPTPVPSLQYSQKTTASQKSSDSLRAERRRQKKLEDGGMGRCQVNGAASPMSVSSHASIGSGSATSASGSRPHFSTFKPDQNKQDQNRNHTGRNHLLLYRNRLSDGYCSDA